MTKQTPWVNYIEIDVDAFPQLAAAWKIESVPSFLTFDWRGTESRYVDTDHQALSEVWRDVNWFKRRRRGRRPPFVEEELRPDDLSDDC
mmetsp:Transcript_57839/g.125816  ORF Transcript_57839/g.125816 Transcript_57839/m.125816 type:complete len:89 (+) Transcript_57839:387-653(+)